MSRTRPRAHAAPRALLPVTDPARAVTGWIDDPRPGLELVLARDDGGWDRVPADDLVARIRAYSHRLSGLLSGAPDDGVDRPVAVLAHTGLAAVAAYWAVLDSGGALVPLAPPGIGDAEETVDRVAGILRAAGCPVLVSTTDVEPVARAAVERSGLDLAVMVVDDDDEPSAPAASARPDATPTDRGDLALVQFTSGSTGDPRGVPVTWTSLAHNTAGMVDHFGLRPDDAFASWIPLHHDMGLVGVLLTAFPAGAPLTLLRPDQFLRSPRRWFEAMTWSTITSAPSFGLGYAARRLARESVADLDLSGWRCTAVGSEPVRLRDLRPFLEITEPLGLNRDGLIPAYGLAETTLMACAQRAGEPLSAVRLASAPRVGDTVDIADTWDGSGPVPSEDAEGRWSVDLGRPDADTVVEILGPDGTPLDDGRFGEIAVSGPSVSAGYRGGGASPGDAGEDAEEGRTRFSGGRLVTGDGGMLLAGRLHVLGRLGTAVAVAGRTVLMEDVDAAVSSSLGMAGGRLAAVSLTGSDPAVVALVLEIADPDGEPEPVVAAARRVVRAVVGDSARVAVVTAPRGSVARTSSGKPRRRALAAHLRGALPPGWAWHEAGAPPGGASATSPGSPSGPTTGRVARAGHRPADPEVQRVFEAVRDEVAVPAGAAVLHEGSLAEGFGNARSDVDFLVVLPGDAATPTMPTVLFALGRRVEVRTRSVGQVAAQFAAVSAHLDGEHAVAADEPGEDVLNRCQRLLGSRVVVDGPVLEQTGAPDPGAFAELVASWWRVRGRHCLARAVAEETLTGTPSEGWAREGVLQLAKAWLAERAETYIESKWTDLQLARVAGRAETAVATRCRTALASGPPPEGWLELARDLDPGAVPDPGSLVVLREPGVTTWTIGGRVHVLHPSGHVAVFDGPAALHWRAIVPGRALTDHLSRDPRIGPALVESLDAGLVGLGLAPPHSAAAPEPVVPAIAMCDPAEPSFPRSRPADTLVRLDGAVPAPAPPGADGSGASTVEADLPWFPPLDGARLASCGLGLVWANIVLENAREDLDGALRDRQWGVACAAARRQVAMAVRALLSASGVYPLPPDADPARNVRRLCATTGEVRGIADEVADLSGPGTAAARIAADPGAVRDRLEALTARIRLLACGEDFPSSFDGGPEWGRTLGIAYDWLRLGAHLDTRIPLDEARDLLETGGRQPHEEAPRDDR